MTIVQSLFYAYLDEGLLPLTGYNPYHMHDYPYAAFTAFMVDDEVHGMDRGGLALQEIMFFENFASFIKPSNCLVIGNSLGWSTVATALAFGDAKVVGVDNNPNRNGLDLTNRIFEKLKLKGGAVFGESPNDLERVCSENLDGPVDFVLIDAIHNNTAIVSDFNGVNAIAAPECVYLFHDVINYKMIEGFKSIIRDSGLDGRLLTKTTSGMGVAYSKSVVSQEFVDYVTMFSDDPEIFKNYRYMIGQVADEMNGLYDEFQ
ncbi:MAG: class I SAM-dependent methyltransferase [Rhodospirillaceae bacterium]|nr:class I SAM-dependent methyltransferase [Rhodospirillaceae bacterium]MBT7231627.1 class I SAM-dependent methyltransferase [Rhodospirillaceae bacterium]